MILQYIIVIFLYGLNAYSSQIDSLNFKTIVVYDVLTNKIVSREEYSLNNQLDKIQYYQDDSVIKTVKIKYKNDTLTSIEQSSIINGVNNTNQIKYVYKNDTLFESGYDGDKNLKHEISYFFEEDKLVYGKQYDDTGVNEHFFYYNEAKDLTKEVWIYNNDTISEIAYELDYKSEKISTVIKTVNNIIEEKSNFNYIDGDKVEITNYDKSNVLKSYMLCYNIRKDTWYQPTLFNYYIIEYKEYTSQGELISHLRSEYEN